MSLWALDGRIIADSDEKVSVEVETGGDRAVFPGLEPKIHRIRVHKMKERCTFGPGRKAPRESVGNCPMAGSLLVRTLGTLGLTGYEIRHVTGVMAVHRELQIHRIRFRTRSKKFLDAMWVTSDRLNDRVLEPYISQSRWWRIEGVDSTSKGAVKKLIVASRVQSRRCSLPPDSEGVQPPRVFRYTWKAALQSTLHSKAT